MRRWWTSTRRGSKTGPPLPNGNWGDWLRLGGAHPHVCSTSGRLMQRAHVKRSSMRHRSRLLRAHRGRRDCPLLGVRASGRNDAGPAAVQVVPRSRVMRRTLTAPRSGRFARATSFAARASGAFVTFSMRAAADYVRPTEGQMFDRADPATLGPRGCRGGGGGCGGRPSQAFAGSSCRPPLMVAPGLGSMTVWRMGPWFYRWRGGGGVVQ